MLQWILWDACIFWNQCFSCFYIYISRSGIAGSYDTSPFSFLKSLHIVFNSGFTSLHFHKKCMSVPFSKSLQIFVFYSLFDDSHSDKYLIVVLIISYVEHLFICSPSACPFWKNVFLGLLPLFFFLIGLIFFLYWGIWTIYIFWILTPYMSYHLQIFSPPP